MYLIGYDIGSSSIKAALVDVATNETVAITKSPNTELEIIAHQTGWAEQSPETWWQHLCLATKELLSRNNIASTDIKAVGIAYQMHGLVAVDEQQKVVRPAIIWCDSRAVEIGNAAFAAIGETQCLTNFLNSPGNFTASKLKWVKDHEPNLYETIDKILLPGDYIAMRLTGEITTTASGLSEGVLWDFQKNDVADILLKHYGIDASLIPNISPTFANQGQISAAGAAATGLAVGTPVTYRAGDQPNNALCLNVLNPGEVAATGGTSGVVYGVVDRVTHDSKTRVNSFAHVNHSAAAPRIGVLLCINGAGIQYAWLQQQIGNSALSYPEMEQLAASVPVGADGLRILPFGNGAERMLNNKNIHAHWMNLNFNIHKQPHLYRAALEGIAFSFVYGMEVFNEMQMNVSAMRVGNDNLFRSNVFSNTIATLANTTIDVRDTTGAVGAAKASGVAIGAYGSAREAVENVQSVAQFEPQGNRSAYQAAYQDWKKTVERFLEA
jgi:xylulokinase